MPEKIYEWPSRPPLEPNGYGFVSIKNVDFEQGGAGDGRTVGGRDVEAVQRMRRETTNYILPPHCSQSVRGGGIGENKSTGGKKGRTEEPKPRKQRRENDNESKRAL